MNRTSHKENKVKKEPLITIKLGFGWRSDIGRTEAFWLSILMMICTAVALVALSSELLS